MCFWKATVLPRTFCCLLAQKSFIFRSNSSAICHRICSHPPTNRDDKLVALGQGSCFGTEWRTHKWLMSSIVFMSLFLPPTLEFKSRPHPENENTKSVPSSGTRLTKVSTVCRLCRLVGWLTISVDVPPLKLCRLAWHLLIYLSQEEDSQGTWLSVGRGKCSEQEQPKQQQIILMNIQMLQTQHWTPKGETKRCDGRTSK